MEDTINVGTRKSELAMIQTCMTVNEIKACFPEVHINIISMSTLGDKQLDKSLNVIGGKGVFTKELETALLDGRIDMAVHSAKDMPMEFPEGLTIGAILKRGDARDMLVTKDGRQCLKMDVGTVIGTGSLRRRLLIQRQNSHVHFKDIRGNVKTRLKKLENGQYDAIILAAAGIERLRAFVSEEERLWYDSFHYEYLPVDIYVPAAGQAIMAVEIRKGEGSQKDKLINEICQKITDKASKVKLSAERSFLQAAGGGCNAPAAAYAVIDSGRDRVTLHTCFSEDGETLTEATVSGVTAEAESLGELAFKQ